MIKNISILSKLKIPFQNSSKKPEKSEIKFSKSIPPSSSDFICSDDVPFHDIIKSSSSNSTHILSNPSMMNFTFSKQPSSKIKFFTTLLICYKN